MNGRTSPSVDFCRPAEVARNARKRSDCEWRSTSARSLGWKPRGIQLHQPVRPESAMCSVAQRPTRCLTKHSLSPCLNPKRVEHDPASRSTAKATPETTRANGDALFVTGSAFGRRNRPRDARPAAQLGGNHLAGPHLLTPRSRPNLDELTS